MEVLITKLSEDETFARFMQFISESERLVGSCSGGGGGGSGGGAGDCGSCQTG